MHLIFTLPSQIHVKPDRIIIYSNDAVRSKYALRRLSGLIITILKKKVIIIGEILKKMTLMF